MSYLRWPTVNAIEMIQLGNPFWFDQVPYFEVKRPYYQKANIGEAFYFQFQCQYAHLSGTDVKVSIVKYTGKEFQTIVSGITWNPVTSLAYPGYKNYEITGNWAVTVEGIYFLKVDVVYIYGDGAPIISLISEPIKLKYSHKNTLLLTYRNSLYNDFDVIFSSTYFASGGLMYLRVDGGLKSGGFTPGGIYKSYDDLNGNPTQLRGTPQNAFKFSFGSSIGVPNYQIDIINRILSLEEFYIDGTQYQLNNGAKPTRAGDEFYPMAGWEVELLKKVNESSKGFEYTSSNDFLCSSTKLCSSELLCSQITY